MVRIMKSYKKISNSFHLLRLLLKGPIRWTLRCASSEFKQHLDNYEGRRAFEMRSGGVDPQVVMREL